jgi:hypothetical protein
MKILGGMKYWTEYSQSSDIELTSYILLAKLVNFKNDDAASMIPIVKWINSQRNSLGGFYSTQVRIKKLTFGNLLIFLIIGYSSCLRCSFKICQCILFKKN